MALLPFSLPGLPGGGLPGLDLSSGPAVSGATTGSGLSTPIFSPFVFDHSNMQVSIKSSGSQSATSASGGQGAPGAGGGLGLNLPMIAILAGAWLLLK